MNKRKKVGNHFLAKFAHHRLALVASLFLIAEILCIIILPAVMHLDAVTSDFTAMGKGPSAAHILGTDEIGRDVLARILFGGRVSLIVGIGSTVISVLIGLPLGVIAGYYQGKLGNLIMRLADMFMSFPTMILILVLVSVIGPSVTTVIVVIGCLGWTSSCKLMYGSVLSVRNKEYVEAAVAIGTPDWKILTQYVIPNAISPLWVSIAFRVSSAIITESSLSFLGAGVQPPQSSWGNIIYAAQNNNVFLNKMWIWVPASIVLLVTIVCINFVGEGVRDALDPKMKR